MTEPNKPEVILKEDVVLNLPFIKVITPLASMFEVNVTFAVLSIVKLFIVVLLNPGNCGEPELNL